MRRDIWIDIINPSHPLFFKTLINELKNNFEIQITLRERAETVELAKGFGLKGKIVESDYESRIKKILSTIKRTLILICMLNHFDYSISFENADCVVATKIRNKISILFLDNDLKYKIKDDPIQNLNNKVKLTATYIIVPDACGNFFRKFVNKKKLITYDGYKEDFYIADYEPDVKFMKKIPYDDFIVLRPEALGSFYVNKIESIVPHLLNKFEENSINVVYLPREKKDFKYVAGYDVYIPKKPLNGLDLCYFSNVILTGSGTMAREAACMGKPSVSFFPSDNFLSVDKQLIKNGKIFHSREPDAICNYVISNYKKNDDMDLDRSKKVKGKILEILEKIINT